MKQTETKSIAININNITKQYDNQIILSDFSYHFYSQGFYLLLGESGCGKTTLLNILSGMTPFENGNVTIAGQEFNNTVKWESIREIIGYVTQDTVLIDYLTVGEQLEISGAQKTDILNILSLFNLDKYYDYYPAQLSGGEKQRIAISQAILHGKQILLLDEPTASLDENNKIAVFKMLKQISESILVICASHDNCAKEYANHIICFNERKNLSYTYQNTYQPQTTKHSKVKLYPYFKKWFTWKNRDKHSLMYLLLVYIIAFCFLLLGDNPTHKTTESIEHIYKINHCISTVNDNGKNLFAELNNSESDVISVMIYNGSAPELTKESILHDSTIFGVLPYDKNFFMLSDKIIYGEYFTDTNQVILSYGKAVEYGNIDTLIGESIVLDMYNGKETFEIVGIFEEFNEVEMQYLKQSCIENSNNCLFLSSKYTEQFQDDPNFNWLGNRTYVLYFNSYLSMNNFYNANCNNENLRLDNQNIDYSIIQRFEVFFYILYPLSFLIILFSLMFCFQTKSIELAYNKHLFSVYDYLGFTKKEIRLCWLRCTTTENIILLLSAFIISSVFTIIINTVNEYIFIFPFRIFTFNYYLIGLFIIVNLFFTTLMSLHSFKKTKTFTWKDLFLEQRDLW